MSKPSSPPSPSPPNSSASPSRSIITIPPYLKRLFDGFPLLTYAANDLPTRSVNVPPSKERADIHAFYDAHTTRRKEGGFGVGQGDDKLHAFFGWACEGDESPNVASFNPACLKWQVYLVFQGIKFHVVPANNHACFPLALPLVVSHPDAGAPFVQPVITSEGLGKWARKNEGISVEEEAYMSLVDGPIRRAWLHSMYLTSNFEKITAPCYISTQTTSTIVRHFLSKDLREAAKAELLKYKPMIDEAAIYLDVKEAFNALDIYFKQAKSKDEERASTTLLDAAVFSYTYLLFELNEGVWVDARLVSALRSFEGLKLHKESIRRNHFRARPPAVWKRLNEGLG